MKTPNGDDVVYIRKDYDGYKEVPGVYFCILITEDGVCWSNDYTPEDLVEEYEGERDKAVRMLNETGRYQEDI